MIRCNFSHSITNNSINKSINKYIYIYRDKRIYIFYLEKLVENSRNILKKHSNTVKEGSAGWRMAQGQPRLYSHKERAHKSQALLAFPL